MSTLRSLLIAASASVLVFLGGQPARAGLPPGWGMDSSSSST